MRKRFADGKVTVPFGRFLGYDQGEDGKIQRRRAPAESLHHGFSFQKEEWGEVPQYYVEGNHEAIIPPAIFDNVQVLMQSQGRGSSRNSCVNILSSRVRCGDCGSWRWRRGILTGR